ncbi:MAG TPA: ATP-binding cassette domain-containing protein [Elusimicrobiota bacterium]|nr:ATP-binding cassette domain-containing protein [Elusimicrobiota bacterium]
MSKPVLEAADLGKQYWTGARTHRTILGRLRAAVTGQGALSPRWAVRHADVALEPGSALAVIGPNGAGKSTLLLMLAGLLSPTEGRVRARGRIGAFLCGGAGLYPELGVEDNIRLTAALFGMSARELSSRRDAIVAFGELEPYLSSRLGELSAGYQARVVFSTALHVPFDLILFDEVFAVGDGNFAARCLERIREARRGGASVVLATHSLKLAEDACDAALYLDGGKVKAAGACDATVRHYKKVMKDG